MKFAAAAILSLAAFVQPAAAQDAAAATKAATEAANAWLAVADSGDYAASWNQAASAFRKMVTQRQWNQAMGAARAPFGAVRSRSFTRAHYTRELPGAPAGEYVVIEYRTEFADKAGTETVVPMREADGSWKVSGYFVK